MPNDSCIHIPLSEIPQLGRTRVYPLRRHPGVSVLLPLLQSMVRKLSEAHEVRMVLAAKLGSCSNYTSSSPNSPARLRSRPSARTLKRYGRRRIVMPSHSEGFLACARPVACCVRWTPNLCVYLALRWCNSCPCPLSALRRATRCVQYPSILHLGSLRYDGRIWKHHAGCLYRLTRSKRCAPPASTR